MNRLRGETSPYLLQHAHNPVDWFPWGEEALEEAKQLDKPILVSIGYAACHWCHVMERESFEDATVAEFMNNHFVNIKIDREERPDIDHIYMDAVQAMTGAGGWPLNVFLTPEGKPFYGGTYFPPRTAFNRPAWTDILRGVSDAWVNKREDIGLQAENMTAHLVQASQFGNASDQDENPFTEESVHSMTAELLKTADTKDGGFGRAPKFPQTGSIAYLLRYQDRFDHPEARRQALLSLDKMIAGGIYDQIGGGLARYSTDNEWLVPHFEKMLYDQALFLGVLCDAYQITRNGRYADTIHQTMDFLQRELLGPDGGFYAALDADSEGEEGKFYVWEKGELDEILGEDAEVAADWFGVTAEGNWEGINILTSAKNEAEWLTAVGLNKGEWREKLNGIRAKMMARRSERIRPGLDDKQILGWNALMNTACSRAYAATGKEEYRELAIRNMDWMLQVFPDPEKGLLHTYKQGIAKFPGFLDDFAYLVQALIYIQEVTGNTDYIQWSVNLTDWVLRNFGETDNQLFYYTSANQKDVVVRKREVYDGAQPSGNAVMQFNLDYLGILTERPEWSERAEAMLAGMGKAITRYPGSFGRWAAGWLQKLVGCAEIVVIGPLVDDLRKEILVNFIPHRIVQSATLENNAFPLLRGKIPLSDTKIYVCQNYNCLQPVNTIAEMLGQLKLAKGR